MSEDSSPADLENGRYLHPGGDRRPHSPASPPSHDWFTPAPRTARATPPGASAPAHHDPGAAPHDDPHGTPAHRPPLGVVPPPPGAIGATAARRDEWPTAPSAALGRTTGTAPVPPAPVHDPAAPRGEGSPAVAAYDEPPTAPVAIRGAHRALPAAYGDAPSDGGRAADEPAPREDSGARPARCRRARLLMLVCAGATGITMADTIGGTLTVSALTPAFTGPGMTEADLQWVMTAYAVPFAALLAAAGRLADLVGRRRLLAIGLGLFSLGAAAAAVSMSFPLLLAARAVQGVGSAAVIPASLGLLLAGVPARRRPQAIGTWMAAAGIGGTTVHAAGGWLLGVQGWRAMFLPSAVIAMLLVYGALALRRDVTTSGRVPDPVGAAALFASIGIAVLAISKAPQWGWSPAMAALCACGLLMLFVAVFRSFRHPVPVLAMSLWRTPMFGLAGTVSLLHGLISFPVLIVTPLFLHRAWGYDLTVAAPAMAPLSVGVLIAGYLSGKLCRRYGPRGVIYVGSLCVAVSCGWVITSVLQTEPRLLTAWLPASVLLGVGLGAMTTGASTAGALSAPPTEFAAAVGGTMTARQIGGAVGTAVAAVLVGRLLMNDPLSGYTAVFAGCMIMAGVAGLVAMFIRPRPSADGPASAAAAAAVEPPALLPAPPEPVAVPRAPALTGPVSLGSPAIPGAPSAMPLSAPVPGDYEPAFVRIGLVTESPAAVLVTGPHLPAALASAPAAAKEPPRPRVRRGSAYRSHRPRERAQRAKERAQAESELRTAVTHFLAAADRLTVPRPGMPQYYLPRVLSAESSVAESAVPRPALPESASAQPFVPEPASPEPAVTEPGILEPIASEPTAPEPGTPEPGTPELGTPELGTLEPAAPEPTAPETSSGRQRPFRRMPYSDSAPFS